VAQVRGAIQAGAIQVTRWWRELEFSQNLSSAGGSDRPDLKMSSLYFMEGWRDRERGRKRRVFTRKLSWIHVDRGQ
jgi:hypothetical protein